METRKIIANFISLGQCFAYVDFENEEGLCAAVLKDNNKLRGSKVKVLRSDPSGNARKGPVTSKRHDGKY